MMSTDTLLSAISILIAIIFGIISICFTFFSIRQQKIHNQNSVRPICSIRLSAIKSKTTITLHNAGTGPMLIKKLVYVHKSSEEPKTPRSLFRLSDWTPKGCTWISFESRDLEANGTINLLTFEQKEDDDDTTHKDNRLRLLKGLGELTIYVEFEDIYCTKFHHKKDLSFFTGVYEKIVNKDNESELSVCKE